MKLFTCTHCGQILYFENVRCERCGQEVGYLPTLGRMIAVKPDGPRWLDLADQSTAYRFCKNWEIHGCNWLIEAADETESYCLACRHNRTVPDVGDPAKHALWLKVETAKRRLFYGLLKLGVPIPWPGTDDPEPLVFEILAQVRENRVVTGHANGVITIALEEADDAAREKMRTSLHEPYRTLLGHFRHEVGHYYWDKLVRDRGELESFRAVFGDERQDYAQALQTHYARGPKAGWQDGYITAYASMHPWEDFAETWAHYLHIVDTLEMAYAFGLSVAPRVASDETLSGSVERNPYAVDDMDELVAQWLPIVFAVNSLNRSMGQADLYPFVLSAPVVGKLGYIRRMIAAYPAGPRRDQAPAHA